MIQGVEYEETFSPTARLTTVRLEVALAAHKGWKVEHLDVPNTYVQGEMDRVIITTVPDGWNEIIGPGLGPDRSPCILNKALYGTPHAGRIWNQVIHNFIIDTLGFEQAKVEPSLYYKHLPNDQVVVIVLYVDDLFITGNDCQEKSDIIKTLVEITTLSYSILFSQSVDGNIKISTRK